MISVSEALELLFDLAPDLPSEDMPLVEASGRVLVGSVAASHQQPPFDASAMDGYAVAPVETNANLTVIGESAAGHPFEGRVGPGEAVRIFTGGMVPEGADRIVIQEDVTRHSDKITVLDAAKPGTYIRRAGSDFKPGDGLSGPKRLAPNDIALLAAMNIPRVPVTRRPVVAIMSTGDELVVPGAVPGPGQIIASNTYGLQAMLRAHGAEARVLPIARDTEASLRLGFDLAQEADLVITIGGASVGDHDLVGPVARDLGMSRAFHKVAMRPGKPLMSGRLGKQMMIGLPGNPVSAMVCGVIFVLPVLRKMMGLPAAPAPRISLPLAEGIGPNGPREHYMRARRTDGGALAFGRQDSSLLSVLGAADLLVVRPSNDPARAAGDVIDCVPLADPSIF